jgi:hypothetical protein
VIAAIAVIARDRKTNSLARPASASSFLCVAKGLRLSILAVFGNFGDFGNLFLFAFSQFPAKLSQLLLLVGLETTHHFSDPARVLWKDLGDKFFASGRNACQDKAFIFALLLSFHQPAFLQVVDNQR